MPVIVSTPYAPPQLGITWDPVNKPAAYTLSNGDLTVASSTSPTGFTSYDGSQSG